VKKRATCAILQALFSSHSIEVILAQRTRLAAITAVLFVAAALRIIGLTTLPQGFRDEEIVQIEIGA
jgi:hypothetical protein